MESCRLDLASWADVLLADAKLSVVVFIYILSTELQVSILYSSTITSTLFFSFLISSNLDLKHLLAQWSQLIPNFSI